LRTGKNLTYILLYHNTISIYSEVIYPFLLLFDCSTVTY